MATDGHSGEQAAEEADGLPPDARRRLDELTGSGGQPGLFTSDLSINEFLLVRQAGFRPRGLVFGSSIFHIGLQPRSWRKGQELTNLTQAMYAARQAAMDRMEEEAAILDADGIVGVRLEANFYDWGRHAAEFIAIGTAVSADSPPAGATGAEGAPPRGDGGGDRPWRPDHGRPFTSDLSGQDFWTLVQSGYAPLALVMGTCVYHVGRRGPLGVAANAGRSRELSLATQGLYEARELAMERMQAEAIAVGAEGVVGVQLLERSEEWGEHIIEFFAVGTAVRPIRDDHRIEAPGLVLPVDDRS